MTRNLSKAPVANTQEMVDAYQQLSEFLVESDFEKRWGSTSFGDGHRLIKENHQSPFVYAEGSKVQVERWYYGAVECKRKGGNRRLQQHGFVQEFCRLANRGNDSAPTASGSVHGHHSHRYSHSNVYPTRSSIPLSVGMFGDQSLGLTHWSHRPNGDGTIYTQTSLPS